LIGAALITARLPKESIEKRCGTWTDFDDISEKLSYSGICSLFLQFQKMASGQKVTSKRVKVVTPDQ